MEIQQNLVVFLNQTPEIQEKSTTPTCPVCGQELLKSGRCNTCYECGWSACEL